MNCLTARKILLTEEQPAHPAGSGGHSKAKQHVSDCHDCTLFFAQQDQVRAIMQAKLPPKTAPPHLREKILSSISEEKRKTKRKVETPIVSGKILRGIRRRRSVLSVAVVLVLFIIFYYVSSWRQIDTGGPDPAVVTMIQDHIASQLKEHPLDLVTSDRTQLEQWFAARVDFNVAIPEFRNTALVGGHLCLVGGKRAVSLSYEQGHVPITLYIIDRSVVNLAALKVVSSINDRPVYHYDEKGCNIILWQEKGLVYGLVSDLNENELLKCINPLTQ